MNNTSKKLYELEGNIIDDKVTEDTCCLSIDDVPEAEKQLHHTAQRIINGLTNYDNVTPEQREIIEHSCMLLYQRINLLFRKSIKAAYLLSGTEFEVDADLAFLRFIIAMNKIMEEAYPKVKENGK